MLEIFIKYSFVILFSFYTYHRLLNLSIRIKYDLLIYFICAFIFSGCIAYFNDVFPYIGLIFMIIPVMVISTIRTKTEFRISIIASVLACGISNTVFIMSLFISCAIFYLFGFNHLANSLYPVLITVLFESIFLIRLFLMKRLRKGMPFLVERSADNVGTTISLLALCGIATLMNNDGTSYIYILPVALIFVSVIYIIIWWHKWITRTYINRKRDQEIQDLYIKIAEKDNYIEKLKEQNVAFGKLIHQDNKLIPAMEMAVTELLKFHITNDSGEQRQRTQALLDDIKNKAKGRKGILDNIEHQPKQFPTTGLASLDALFTYLSAKAAKVKVTLDLSVYSNVRYLIQNEINENDLNTLLAEIIDNCIIAASQSNVKKILINFELNDGAYVINIFDSGGHFAPEALKNFGLISTTMYEESGGSGIGLMNIYEIINRYNASLIIDELLPPSGLFVKKISVRFDHKGEYVLSSNRTDIFEMLSERSGLTIVTLP